MEIQVLNVNGVYSPSTSEFTAPKSGNYYFHGHGLKRMAGGRLELTFFKNGVNLVARNLGNTLTNAGNDHDDLAITARGAALFSPLFSFSIPPLTTLTFRAN